MQATAVTVPSGGLPEETADRRKFFYRTHLCWSLELTPLGGPSACSKRGRFHCQAKIKIIFVSSSIFDSNDAESVEKSHPPFRLVMRVALIVFQIYGLQKQGRDRECADADFSTASEFRRGKQDADLRGARGSSWVSFVF